MVRISSYAEELTILIRLAVDYGHFDFLWVSFIFLSLSLRKAKDYAYNTDSRVTPFMYSSISFRWFSDLYVLHLFVEIRHANSPHTLLANTCRFRWFACKDTYHKRKKEKKKYKTSVEQHQLILWCFYLCTTASQAKIIGSQCPGCYYNLLPSLAAVTDTAFVESAPPVKAIEGQPCAILWKSKHNTL